MEITILDKKDESLLSRKVVTADISFQGVTPSKVEIKKKVAALLKADEKVIAIKKVKTLFGQEKAKLTLYEYDSEKSLKDIEPKCKEKPKTAEPEEEQESPEESKKAEKPEAKEEKPKAAEKEEDK